MSNGDIIKSIKLRPKYEHISDELITDIIEDVTNDIRNYIHYNADEKLPEELMGIIKTETIRRLNRIGYEGISNYSFSGISNSFIEGMSKDEIRLLKRKRRLIYGSA